MSTVDAAVGTRFFESCALCEALVAPVVDHLCMYGYVCICMYVYVCIELRFV